MPLSLAPEILVRVLEQGSGRGKGGLRREEAEEGVGAGAGGGGKGPWGGGCDLPPDKRRKEDSSVHRAIDHVGTIWREAFRMAS